MSSTPEPTINDIMKCTEPTIIEGGLAVDDRGQLSFVNNLAGFKIKRFYQVHNHQQGFVRAWHGHKHESKLVWVIQGAAVVKVVRFISQSSEHWHEGVPQMNTSEAHSFTLSAAAPQVLYIPKGYYNGFKTLTQDTSIMFFTNKTLLESAKDDIRISCDWQPDSIWDIEQR